jgi:two-component system OmpR family response regulator
MTIPQRLNVLVVDRDEGSALQLKSFLSQAGHRVVLLADADRVGEELRKHRYQVVFLDVSPDNRDGFDSLGEIRRIDRDLCVIATTSLPTVEMAVASMRLQAFHYLSKPLEEQELAAVLQAAIREKGLLVDLETRLNTEVGGRIREKRQGAGLTLKQLANRTGLSVSLISQIELGKSAASMSTLHKLATALGTRMTYFFETV